MLERMKLGKELWDAGVSAEFMQNKENPNMKAQLDWALSKVRAVYVIRGGWWMQGAKC